MLIIGVYFKYNNAGSGDVSWAWNSARHMECVFVTRSFLQPIRNPKDLDGPQVQAVLPGWLVLKTYKYQEARYHNFRVVMEVLKDPDHIYSGIRNHNDHFWCFSRKPEHWYNKDGHRIPFPKELVYTVYLNDRYEIFDFFPRDALSKDSTYCKDHEQTFGAVIWTANHIS